MAFDLCGYHGDVLAKEANIVAHCAAVSCHYERQCEYLTKGPLHLRPAHRPLTEGIHPMRLLSIIRCCQLVVLDLPSAVPSIYG